MTMHSARRRRALQLAGAVAAIIAGPRSAQRTAAVTALDSALQPDLFHAHAVVDAVDHRRVALDVILPAGAGAVVVEHRPGHVLGQPPLDVPHHVLALLLIGLPRLGVDHL